MSIEKYMAKREEELMAEMAGRKEELVQTAGRKEEVAETAGTAGQQRRSLLKWTPSQRSCQLRAQTSRHRSIRRRMNRAFQGCKWCLAQR